MTLKLSNLRGSGIMPEHAPAYPQQWSCPEAHTIIVTVEGEEEGIKEILSYTPFEYVSNYYQVWIADLRGHSLAPETNGYKECGITMPARYGTVSGGYSPWMYCTSIAAVLCGREILGYPKQLADIDFVATDIAATGVVRKNGVDLVKLGFVFDDKENPDIDKIVNLQKINVNRILYKTIPKATDYTADLKQVIFRDSARKVGHSKPGRGSVVFGELESDPIGVIGIKRILGATYTISNYGGGLEKEKRTVLAEL